MKKNEKRKKEIRKIIYEKLMKFINKNLSNIEKKFIHNISFFFIISKGNQNDFQCLLITIKMVCNKKIHNK